MSVFSFRNKDNWTFSNGAEVRLEPHPDDNEKCRVVFTYMWNGNRKQYKSDWYLPDPTDETLDMTDGVFDMLWFNMILRLSYSSLCSSARDYQDFLKTVRLETFEIKDLSGELTPSS